MRKHFVIKAITFYVTAAVCALVITGFVNMAIYWFFMLTKLTEFGDMLMVKLGMAMTEALLATYCVSQLSEDVLYNDDEDEDPFSDDI